MSNQCCIRVTLVGDNVVLVITDEDGNERTCTMTEDEAIQTSNALADLANKAGPDGIVRARLHLDD